MFLVAEVVAFALAQDEAVGRPVPPDISFYNGPTHAADHEAVVASSDSTEAGERRSQIVRSGPWLRGGSPPGGVATSHSNFELGVSIGYSRDAQGAYRTLSIHRTSTDSYSRFRRIRTGERDRSLGEECEVWKSIRVGEEEGTGLDWRSCETSDGIQLWSRVTDSTGHILAASRMISFRRRPVRADEVRPPRDLLDWRHWRSLRDANAPPFPSDRLRHYEVRLAAHGGLERSRVLRRRNAWTYEESVDQQGRRRIDIDNRVISLQHISEANGTLISLTIHPLEPRQNSVNDSLYYEPIEPVEREDIAGERCVWSRPGSGGSIVVTSGDHRTCVTRDGLALGIRSHHRVLIANLRATFVSRRRLPESALMPPRRAFDWRAWGIEPAER